MGDEGSRTNVRSAIRPRSFARRLTQDDTVSIMRHYTTLTALLFTIISILHLVRAFAGWEVVFAGWSIPMWVSGVAFVISAIIAVWGWKLSMRAVETKEPST